MPATLTVPAVPAPARGLAGRLIGVLTSPRATYAEVAARPQWAGAFVVVLFINVSSVMAILSTDVGQRAALDQQLQTLEAFGQTVSDAQYEQMQRMAPYSRYIATAGQMVAFPTMVLVIAGVAFGVFNGVLGDDATFRQLFAVVTFSSTVTALRAVFSTPLNYARESLSSPTNLAAVLPFFDENTFGARVLGSVDLFLIWWSLSLAIGLGVLYKRRTAPIATTMLVAYGIIGVGIAIVRSALAGA